MWRTLPLLALRPGELTRRYVEGERARFVSPVGMFLFSAFMMFAIFSAIGSYAYRDRTPDSGSASLDEGPERPGSVAELQRQYADERAENVREIEALAQARRRMVSMGRPTNAVDRDIEAVRGEMAEDAEIFRRRTALQRNEEARNERHRQPVEGVDIHPGGGVSLGWIDDAYSRAKRNPNLLFYKLQSNAYKFSWALIPLSVPLVALLFLTRRYRRFTAYDHLVFVTYSITFMSIFAIFYTLLKALGMNGTIALVPFLIPPIHIYRHLKGTYGLTRWAALWRTAVVLIFATVALAMFGSLLLLLGVAG